MTVLHRRILSVALASVILLGCSPAAPSTGDPIDYQGLLAALEGTDLQVEAAATIDQEFFSPQGRLVEVEGDFVQVFEYSDEAARRAESELIGQDGSSVGTTMITWIDTPHFWAQGEVIVLYVGSNPEVINALNQVLGEPIARGG